MTCGFRNCQSRACGSIVRPDGHELAYCVAHEAIARHLPTLRTATCCTSEGCGRPQGSRSPLCKSCRPRYAAWGLDGYPVPQEAPMPTTPEAQTPPVTPYDVLDATAKAWFAMPQEERDACLVAISVATISTGDSAPTPPAAPQEAAGEGATPSLAAEPLHPLEARRASLIARLYMAGFVKVDGPAEYLWRFNGPNGAVLIPVGHPCEVERDFADMLDHAEKECAKVEAAATPADTVEPSEGDVADAPLFVGGTTVAPMQPMSPDLAALTTDPMQQRREAVVARLLALGAEEQPGRHPTARVFALKYEAYIVPDVSYSAKDMDAAMQSVERTCDRLESFMAGRWSQKHTAPVQPTAPGPTLAEVQAELARERERADRAEMDAVQERERADEAKAELAAIAALLDPEDSPAYDSDDQPIPLPVRVQTALMPHSESVLVRGLRAERDAFWGIISDTEWIVHHCGSYGSTASLADRVLRLLPVERQRAILELKRSEAYIEVARINARFLNPPPPGRLEECAAEVAEVEAKIAALDAGDVRE